MPVKPKALTPDVAVSAQIDIADVADVKAAGFKSIVCNRPDGEASDQSASATISAAATNAGLAFRYLPIVPGKMTDEEAAAFNEALETMPKPVFAYCRSGARSEALWARSKLIGAAKPNTELQKQLTTLGEVRTMTVTGLKHDIVIVGGGAAGIATAASLLSRRAFLDIAIIEPADTHYYQPGWTMVGAGVFNAPVTERPMASVMPRQVKWIKATVNGFDPATDAVLLDDGRRITYKQLIVSPGLKLDWQKVEGLSETLGKNGVTSNYRYDLAPYTWELVRKLKSGRAVFTQPPMPIKCAGAPQKAMYLSADHWYRNGLLKDIDVGFYNAGGVLFGVADYVPALMEYVKRYDAKLNFFHNLVAIDGPGKKAWFNKAAPNQPPEKVEVPFDMIHVTPPQCAPDFVRTSVLADAAGWVDVDQGSMRHKKFANIFSLGDAGSMPNAKTAAAARKQAPIVAINVLADLGYGRPAEAYDGYGSCPLTVERGKIVLAEFGYGGKLMPSFSPSFINGTRPSRKAWFLKQRLLPPIYWRAMLKGKEWYAKPEQM
jgi:sulfide:quinone oxidoreductase